MQNAELWLKTVALATVFFIFIFLLLKGAFFAIIFITNIKKVAVMKKTKILDGIIVFILAVVIILFVNTLLFLKLGIAGMGIAEALLFVVPLMLVLLRR